MRRAVALAVLALAVVGVVLTGAAPAGAHAYLVGSNPTDGDRLATAPRELRLDFSEHVVLAATRLEVRTAHGAPVAVGEVRLETADAGDTEEPATIVATLPALRVGAYRVSWETLSSDDLHRTSGLIVFGVGRRVAPAASATSTLRPEEALVRAGLLLTMAVTFGGLVAQRVLRRALTGPASAAAQAVVGRLALPAAAASPLLAAGLLTEQLLASGGGTGALLIGAYGVRWAVRFLGLLLLCLAWWSARSRSAPPGRTAAAGVVLAAVGTALLGHHGPDGTDVVRVVAGSAHVIAALSWTGALACLAAAVLAGPRSRRVPDVLATLRAFGPAAGTCLGVVVVTGVYLSSDVVISVDAALMTAYGRTLLLKVLLVGAAAALGLRHHLRLRGPHDLDPPRRSVLTEAGLLVAVVGVTGLLASTATATDPSFARPDTPSAGAVSRQVGDLQLTAGLSPNRRGPALAVVEVFDTRRPAPAPVLGVDVRIGHGPDLAAQRLDDGRWTVPVSIDVAGPTTISVTVLRAGVPQSTGRFGWTVPGRHASHPVVVSQAPVRTWLRWVAAALAAALVTGWAVAGRGGRTRRGGLTGARHPAIGDDRVAIGGP